MNEARFQTAGPSDLNIAEITRCWSTATAFVFWWPQLLKLDMVCRIPSNTLTLPDTKMKNIYKYTFMVYVLTYLVSDTLFKFER